MKITWLGHSGFRIDIEQAVLLIDPWLTGAPAFPAPRKPEAIRGATHILQTHAHFDHSANGIGLAKELGIPLVGIYDLMSWVEQRESIRTIGFNRGGTVDLGGARVTLVAASHSSSIGTKDGPIYAGSECGFMISGEGHTIYVSGDTDIMADMDWMGDYHRPDIGILACGGHFTMDMDRAAYAAKRYFDFRMVIPCHIKTMPILAQNADRLRALLPDITVIEPDLLVPIDIPPA